MTVMTSDLLTALEIEVNVIKILEENGLWSGMLYPDTMGQN
jgi:hypothetical protein